MSELTKEKLELLYKRWNKAEYISPDPLETVVKYADVSAREIAGLLASSMAYGRVSSLLVPLKRILSIMGSSPADFAMQKSIKKMRKYFDGIIYRFDGKREFAALIYGAGRALKEYGSLEKVFLKGYETSESNKIILGLNALVKTIKSYSNTDIGHLLPDPLKGSACKRLLLYLRWMVRKDAVDPGGWNGVSPSDLLIPLDTWIHKISLRAGWSNRASADMKSVLEISEAFAKINPKDPIKYDFALSRFGIRSSLNLDMLFS